MRSLALLLLACSTCFSCGGAETIPGRRSARVAASQGSVEAGSGADEPALGSPDMALHLFAAPPPPSLVALVGPGPRSPAHILYPSPHRVVGRTFGSGPSGCHLALDLAARMGDPIQAAERGIVAYQGPFATGGQVVMLVHPGGWVTVYAHLSASLVRAGDRVRRGQPIARAGATGNAAGPHLHFVLLVDGHPVDPLAMLDPPPVAVGPRRFASAEKAAEVWRHCPAKGRAYAPPR